MLQPSKPCDEMKTFLNEPTYQSKVIYLEGNPLRYRDLQRCVAERSICVVILTDKFTKENVDLRNILSAMAVKNYVQRNQGHDVRVCIQLIKAENKKLFTPTIDQIICI